MDNLKKHKGQPGVIYSEFVSGEGLALFQSILDIKGYKSWNDSHKHSGDAHAFGISGGYDTYGYESSVGGASVSKDDEGLDNIPIADNTYVFTIDKRGKRIRHDWDHVIDEYNKAQSDAPSGVNIEAEFRLMVMTDTETVAKNPFGVGW